MSSETVTQSCSRCGILTDQQVDDMPLCDDCYTASGSCCAEAEDDQPEDK